MWGPVQPRPWQAQPRVAVSTPDPQPWPTELLANELCEEVYALAPADNAAPGHAPNPFDLAAALRAGSQLMVTTSIPSIASAPAGPSFAEQRELSSTAHGRAYDDTHAPAGPSRLYKSTTARLPPPPPSVSVDDSDKPLSGSDEAVAAGSKSAAPLPAVPRGAPAVVTRPRRTLLFRGFRIKVRPRCKAAAGIA
jgi:hypothetical protein